MLHRDNSAHRSFYNKDKICISSYHNILLSQTDSDNMPFCLPCTTIHTYLSRRDMHENESFRLKSPCHSSLNPPFYRGPRDTSNLQTAIRDNLPSTSSLPGNIVSLVQFRNNQSFPLLFVLSELIRLSSSCRFLCLSVLRSLLHFLMSSLLLFTITVKTISRLSSYSLFHKGKTIICLLI